jgi:hypothetical protein
LLLLLATASHVQAAPTPPLPQVTVRLDTVEPVDVNHDGDTVVVVNGTVNITAPSFVEVGVALNVSVLSLYWPAEVDPHRGNLTGSGDVPFTVTVSVPARAAADAAAVVQVVANVSAYGIGRDFTGDTTIPIVQFYGVALEPAVPLTSPTTFDAQVGADTSFSFRLQNTGNGKDSFEVRVANAAELQNLGITTDLGSPITNVASGVKVVVTGSVHLPSTLALGDFQLNLEALSTGAVSDGSQAVASTQKVIHAVEAPPGPDPGNGGNGGDGNGTGGPSEGSPGLGAVEAVAAVGAVALAAGAVRRVRRP